MEAFYSAIASISNSLAIPLFIFLIGGGIFLTAKLGFLQFRHFGHIMSQTFGGIFKKEEGIGTVTPFQAVSSALASTIGAANIVGVPVAIALGGPGAIFWMWMVALIGMATKYTEVVLGILYRGRNKNDEYVGGPMYYIDQGLGWKKMAIGFAVIQLVVVFSSASVQSNSLTLAMQSSIPVPSWTIGLIIAVMVAIILRRGIRSIGALAEKLVPLMVVLYLASALVVIGVHYDQILSAFGMIFTYAFQPIAATGGFVGAAVAAAIRWGVARGLYSNEAGMGSAAIFHAGAKITHPAKQGFWGAFEVFLDTIIVCTITALLILTTDVWKTIPYENAASMAGEALGTVFGDFVGGWIITLSIFVFAFTTIMMVVYSGEKIAEYLFGTKVSILARYLFIGAIVLGAVSSLVLVWSLLDIMLVLIVVPNMVALLLLSGKVRELTLDYFETFIKNPKASLYKGDGYSEVKE